MYPALMLAGTLTCWGIALYLALQAARRPAPPPTAIFGVQLPDTLLSAAALVQFKAECAKQVQVYAQQESVRAHPDRDTIVARYAASLAINRLEWEYRALRHQLEGRP